jgi:hypothetical protein
MSARGDKGVYGDAPGPAVGATSGPATEAEVRAMFEERARAELAAADAAAPGSDRVAWRGALLAEVAVVKGLPGPAEVSGNAALAGPDGEAAIKALEALGWSADAVFFTLSRPEPGLAPELRGDRLRLQLEAVDPALVLALDSEAAQDVALAFGIQLPGLGSAVRVFGRRIVAVDGLEASLSDQKRKARVWAQMQAAKPEGPVY